MDSDALIALILAGLVLAGSPGPNTMSLAAAGAAYGARRSVPFMSGLAVGMLPAVELEDQPSLRAKEVDDVASDRGLPTEAISFKATAAQPKPKLSFSVGRAQTQISRPNDMVSIVFAGRFLHGRPLTLSLSLKGRGNPFIVFLNPLPLEGEGWGGGETS